MSLFYVGCLVVPLALQEADFLVGVGCLVVPLALREADFLVGVDCLVVPLALQEFDFLVERFRQEAPPRMIPIEYWWNK